MPTRLLQIANVRDGHMLRIVDTKSNKVEPYTALSYCWGGPQAFQTTHLTLDQRRTWFNARQLPQTLFDAVKVTMALGIQYLWVDSQCIIEDDEHDKGTQIATMDKVYLNASLTIIAARASTVTEGFLYDRTEIMKKATMFRFPFLCSNGIISEVTLISIPEIPPHMMEPFYRSEPLDKRAWAFQEKMLSRRALYFGTLQTVLYCRSSKSDILYRDGWRTTRADYIVSLPSDSHGLSSPAPQEDEEILERWHETVREFSGRQLTVAEDSLPAISGIAQIFAPYLGDYIAGVWTKWISHDLFWYSLETLGGTEAITRRPRSSMLHTPSWSWAAVNNYCDWERLFRIEPTDEPAIKLLEHNIMPRQKGVMFGRVSSGVIKLWCLAAKPAMLSCKVSSHDLLRSLWELVDHGKCRRMHAYVIMDAVEKEFTSVGTNTLPVMLIYGGKLKGVWGTFGLILRQVGTQFSRIGYFSYFSGISIWQRPILGYEPQSTQASDSMPRICTSGTESASEEHHDTGMLKTPNETPNGNINQDENENWIRETKIVIDEDDEEKYKEWARFTTALGWFENCKPSIITII